MFSPITRRNLEGSAVCIALAIVAAFMGPLDWPMLLLTAVLIPIVFPVLDWIGAKVLSMFTSKPKTTE